MIRRTDWPSITGMLASREQWTGHLLDARKGDGFDRQGLESALRYLVEFQLDTARKLTPDSLLSELPRFYNYALANTPVDEAELKALLEACGGFDCDFLDLPTCAEALPHWRTMINRFLTAAGDKWRAAPDAKAGFPAPSSAKGEEQANRKAWKAGFKMLLDEHSGNDELRDIFNTIRMLPSPEYEDEAWKSLKSLMRILLRAAENWKVVKIPAQFPFLPISGAVHTEISCWLVFWLVFRRWSSSPMRHNDCSSQ